MNTLRFPHEKEGLSRMIFSNAWLLSVIAICCVMITFAGAHTVTLPASLVNAGATVETVVTGINFGEGPAVDPEGALYFSDRNPSRVWRVPPGGTAEVFRNPANDANGMVFDREGRLVVCEKRGLSRTEMDSTVTMLITADTLGAEGPNDLTLTSDSGIFFSSSVWNGSGRVFYLSPDRTLTTILSFTNPPLGYPNGIEYVEEKRLLYVNVTQKDSILKYRVNDDMSVTALGPLCGTPSPDGLALDTEGNLWVANTNGNHQVTVFDSNGTKLGEIILDGQESVQNCAFGGLDRKTLYITGKTAVFSLKTLVAGRNTSGATSAHGHEPEVSSRMRMMRRNSAEAYFELFDLRGARVSGIRPASSSGIAVMRKSSGETMRCLTGFYLRQVSGLNDE